MISILLILNSRGRVLISRNFRSDMESRAVASAFRNKIISKKESKLSPVLRVGDDHFLFVRHKGLYLVACTKKNVNATLIFQFLYKLVDLFKAYFNGELSEQKVNENFALIYELLDEVLDFGYPQEVAADVLKQYITGKNLPPKSTSEMKQISKNVTGVDNWRKKGIVYKRNEVFLDVIENVNMLMSAKGTPLNAEVIGKIVMKCYLSGMPECKLGLNDKLMTGSGRSNVKSIALDDIKFHQCVKLGKFDSDKSICFVPLDGEFEVMSYRINEGIIPPFRLVSPVVREIGKTKVEIDVSVRSVFNSRLFGKNVIIKIPVPTNTSNTKIRTTFGKAKYRPGEHAIIWSLKRFPGQMVAKITATVNRIVTTSSKKWAKPPIQMKFQVPMFAASQIHVRFLRCIENKLNYKAIKWVRYISRSDSYHHRI